MDFITEYHSVGSVDLLDLVLAKIKRLAFRKAVITCCNGIYKVALVIADCAVGSDNIFCGTDFIGSAFQSCGFINRLVNGGDFIALIISTAADIYAIENFALFGNGNLAFLSVVRLLYLSQNNAALLCGVFFCDVKGDGCTVKHIAVRSLNLYELVALIVHEHFGSDKIALAVGVECVDCEIRGVRNGHSDQSIIGCINLESCSLIGDGSS